MATGPGAFHADRFLPVVSTIYFPEGCNWMPFERCEKNHFMNEVNTQEIATQYLMKPDHWKDREIFSNILPPNTAITSFHHVHHRRGQFSKPG